LGVASALYQDTVLDYVLRLVALVGLAVPTFWLLTLAITYTALWWGWLPPFGYREFLDDPQANLQQFALPGSVLGISLAAPIMRMTRSTMLETLRADYIRTARAKGLAGRTVVVRHALRNALVPVITVIGLQMGGLLGGTVLVESVAGLPGLGRLLVDAINRRDYSVLQGAVIVTAGFVILSNFIVDIAYVYLDPRIRP
ncbi:MAG: ABC transporter permease, partial [Dehalococcoidia bacterium]|nr:ABC transporter permease [Dehalococcoidia bacterium]